MADISIPFHKPTITGSELEYLTQAVQSRKFVGDGPFAKRCAELLQKRMGAQKVLMTPSCTAALEMAAILSSVEPGDEVIMPSFTFVSTANAVVLRGGRPVFVDIRPDTLNIDETKIEQAITPKTKAISVVHYAGVSCEMNAIMDIAKKHSLKVVEDAAQGVNATYFGRPLGTIGDFGCFSFHETKNFVSGEGGAILINRNEDLERSEIVREKGTNRGKFMRGQVDKYTWVDVGSSYLPSDLSCAFLLAQLEAMDDLTGARSRVYRQYFNAFDSLAQREVIALPVIPNGCESNFHIFHFIVSNATMALNLLSFLRAAGIGASSHYVPLHTSPYGRQFHSGAEDLRHTQSLSERLVRLPLHGELSEAQVDVVIDRVNHFFRKL